MSSPPHVALSGLARAFVQHGKLLEAEALACSSPSANPNDFLVEVIQRGLMSGADIALFAAETFGSPTLDLNAFDAAHLPIDAIDRKLMVKHQVVALGRRGNRLSLALSDPSNLRILDEIRFQTGLAVDPVVVEIPKLMALVEQLSESAASALKDLTGEEFDMDVLGQEGKGEQPGSPDDGASEVDDAPVVRFIQKLLIDAINEGASDIHFEPYEKYYRVRFRTDGILREIAQPPLVLSVTRDSTIAHFTSDATSIRRHAGLCLKRVDLTRRIRLLGVRVGSLVKVGAPGAGDFPSHPDLPLFQQASAAIEK